MRKYSYPQKILSVNGKKIKRLHGESGSQYWERVKKIQIEAGASEPFDLSNT